MQKYLIFSLILLILTACGGEEDTTPRPWGFARIEIPQKVDYSKFSNTTCPFTFEYPAMGEITRNQADSCWVDIAFPKYGCKWHISNKDITSTKDKMAHYEDFRKLVYKHSKKASNITELPFKNAQGEGVKFEIYGNVGSPIEVFFSNPKHTMTLDLYFNTAMRNDSLAPVIDFMKKEIEHTMTSLAWK